MLIFIGNSNSCASEILVSVCTTSSNTPYYKETCKYIQNFLILGNNNQLYSSSNNPVTPIKSLVLLVEFKDVKFSISEPSNSFNQLLNSSGYSYNGATGSAADYLNANFKGFHTFSFDVSNIISLPYNMEKYGAATSSANDIDAKQMVVDACKIAYENGTDFSVYDCNKDGTVDNIHIIYAGYNQAVGGPSNAIWSHQWSIEDKNIAYNGVKLSSYSCSSELRGTQDTIINSIGYFCHEYLHSWGLIDMYDTNKETEGMSKALYGNLSIMDNGYQLNEGNTPPYLNAIEREMLGIAQIIDLEIENTYTLLPIYKNGTIGRIKTNTEGEYFLLECRSMQKWDKFIGGEGLIVYHVDKSENIYGGISSVKRWDFNNVNAFAQHQCAKVVPAIDNGTGTLSQIFFPGTENATTLSSANNLKDWNGYPVGIALENINYKNNVITFSTLEDIQFSDSAPYAKNIVKIEYQESARIEWDSDSLSNELKWNVIIEDSLGTLINKMVVDSTFCLVRELEREKEYKVTISSIENKICGKESTITIKTKEIRSIYPYIFVKGNYKTNETIDLRVFDIVEPFDRIIWNINGVNINNDFYTLPPTSTVIEISAQIIYKDGSDEYIYKTITVH